MQSSTRTLAVILLLAPVVGPAATAASRVRIEAVASSGQQAPGVPAGVRFSSFQVDPSISDAGEIAFRAWLSGAGVDFSNDEGIWLASGSGELTLLVREGDPVPEIPGGRVGNIRELVQSASGQIAFVTSNGVFGPDGAGGFALLARNGAQARGAPAGVVLFDVHFFSLVVNNSGQVAFRGSLRGPGIDPRFDTAVFGPAAVGPPSMIVREGPPPPGMSASNLMEIVGSPQLNDSGETVFWARWVRIFTSPLEGLFSRDALGHTALRLVQGDPAPGASDGSTFHAFTSFSDGSVDDRERGSTFSLNAVGELATLATALSPTGHLQQPGIWLQRPSGETAPIWIEGGESTFGGVSRIQAPGRFARNNRGQVAFQARARLDDGSDHGAIFRTDERGRPVPLVFDYLKSPALPAGSRMEYLRYPGPGINDLGDVIFEAGYSDAGDHVADAIFFAPAGGSPLLVVGGGDLLDVAGEIRTAAQLRFQSERADNRAVDESGRIVLWASFVGGSTAILRATVPVFDDADADGEIDLVDNCPEVPNPQVDLDGDGLGDACDPYPQDLDPEKGQLRLDLAGAEASLGLAQADLAAAREQLAQCLERRFFVDLDGDGEDDSTDRCPGTPPGESVDEAGCSLAQFCARVNAVSGAGRLFACLAADWRADEPLHFKSGDCVIEPSKDSRGRPLAECTAP